MNLSPSLIKGHMDTLTPKDRSRLMAKVRSKGNKSTERRFCAALASLGVRGWSKQPDLLGHPDVAFLRERLAVFLDGCFWHRCPVCDRPLPKTNAEYWEKKIARNVARDARNTRALRGKGWAVVRLWEHEIRKSPKQCVATVQEKLTSRKKRNPK